MMIEIHDEDLIRRLQALADARGESVDSVLKMLLDGQDMHQPATRQSGSKRLLEVARRVNLHSDSMTDTSERTNEIIRDEYADYLANREDADG